jgi:hypothetical protein
MCKVLHTIANINNLIIVQFYFRASLKNRLIKEKEDGYGRCKKTFRWRAVALQGKLMKQMTCICFFSKGVFRGALQHIVHSTYKGFN